MNPIVDGIMIILFILFMVFILGGYHRTKYAQRDEQEKRDQDKLGTDNKEENS